MVAAPMSSSFRLTPTDIRQNLLLNMAITPLNEGDVGESGAAAVCATQSASAFEPVSAVATVAAIFASQAEAVRTRAIEFIHSPIDPVQRVYTGIAYLIR